MPLGAQKSVLLAPNDRHGREGHLTLESPLGLLFPPHNASSKIAESMPIVGGTQNGADKIHHGHHRADLIYQNSPGILPRTALK